MAAGPHALTSEQAMWLLMIAASKKALAMTMPRDVQRQLTDKGLIQISSGGHARATVAGKVKLLSAML